MYVAGYSSSPFKLLSLEHRHTNQGAPTRKTCNNHAIPSSLVLPSAQRSFQPKCRGGKSSWPELVGKKGSEAKAVIQRENPAIDAVVYAPQDAIVTDKYCCNRVRLIMNCDAGCDYDNATVFQVPIVG